VTGINGAHNTCSIHNTHVRRRARQSMTSLDIDILWEGERLPGSVSSLASTDAASVLEESTALGTVQGLAR
jgi:hypothetical protein